MVSPLSSTFRVTTNDRSQSTTSIALLVVGLLSALWFVRFVNGAVGGPARVAFVLCLAVLGRARVPGSGCAGSDSTQGTGRAARTVVCERDKRFYADRYNTGHP